MPQSSPIHLSAHSVCLINFLSSPSITLLLPFIHYPEKHQACSTRRRTISCWLIAVP